MVNEGEGQQLAAVPDSAERAGEPPARGEPEPMDEDSLLAGVAEDGREEPVVNRYASVSRRRLLNSMVGTILMSL